METVASKVGVEEEKHLIQLTLNNYLQGRPIKDIERLRNAFHPDAYIRTIIEGKLIQWTLPQYLGRRHWVSPRAIDFCQLSVH
jgi:hypothetical protein